MPTTKLNPGWRSGSIFLIGLSLSIGWGIRGNFGHEYGAAFAGCLAAIAVALLSGRDDWRQRVPYFAFFGALGWGFGASQSYMQVLSYSESGHAVSQWFGYASIFYIGFLWAALGGAGTAFAAVANRQQITNIFKPLLFIFGAWLLLDLIEDPVAKWLQRGGNFDDTLSRHKNPLYWFDADYLPAFFALLGAGVYDLYERRRAGNRIYLPVFAAGGAISGFIIQLLLQTAGLVNKLASALTYLQGDPTYINPETGRQAFEASNLLNNWPQWFSDYPQHIGWVIGLILGITAYFLFFGKFRNGASLFVYMGGGWLLAFLAFPVLGSLLFAQYGGIRMTPPRADDWAGITGVLLGTSIWLWRNNLRPVAVASLISGTIGGLGFAGMQWLKQLMMSFGSSRIIEAKGILPGSEEFNAITTSWAGWQGQNWHSFLEQSYGFVNGIAIAVALGFLASRIKIKSDDNYQPAQTNGKWTRAFSVLFILLGLTYFNIFKNVDVWSGQLNPTVWKSIISHADGTTETAPALWDLPYLGKLPGFDFLHMTPSGWFNLTWALLVIACIIIVVRHYRSPLSIIPKSPLARGQLIFLILLWIMVVANFERALTGWHPSRLLTEWVIFINAIIATVLVLLLPRDEETVTPIAEPDYKPLYKRLWIAAIATLLISSVLFLVTNRMIYHYPEYNKLDHQQYHTRFGPDASWKTKPNLKNADNTVKSVMDRVITHLYKTMNAKELSELDDQKVMSLFSRGELQILSSNHWMFEVNVPVVVSVMRSSEQKKMPFWLTEKGFVKTYMVVKNEQTTYEVWQKSFEAGTVGLGINGFENYGLHYFVSVTPRNKSDQLKLSNFFPENQYVGVMNIGAFTYHDWDELILTEVPDELRGQKLLTTVRGRAVETHLIGAFRTSSYPSSQTPDQIMLTWSSDPSTGIDIQWRTDTTVATGIVKYREKSTTLEFSAKAGKYLMEDRVLMNDRFINRFTAELRNLKPGTTYEYQFIPQTDWPEKYTFSTQDNNNQFSFIWFGDTHYSPKFGGLFNKAEKTHPDAAFYSIAGDMVSDGLHRNQWDDLFEFSKDVICRKPLMSVLGNHDNRSGLGALMYRELFSYPKNGPEDVEKEHTYSFRYRNALFLMIDATSPIDLQSSWIEDQLANTDATWKFAMFHFPPYNWEEPYLNIQKAWVPIFDKYHVDMVMGGHIHYYMRSKPMKGGKVVSSYNDGTVYVISVGIPTNKREITDEPYAACRNTEGYLYQYLQINGNRLTYKAANFENKLIDSFNVKK